MERQDWQHRFAQELQAAKRARDRGNEGRARVCARRAVGVLLDAWFASQGISFDKPSAYDKIRFFLTLDTPEEQVRTAMQHFIMRVTPEYTLPVDADLVEEAQWLRTTLYPE